MAVDNNFRITVMGTQGLQGPPGGGGEVDNIIPGNNISVDNTNPESPVVSTLGGTVHIGVDAPEQLDGLWVDTSDTAVLRYWDVMKGEWVAISTGGDQPLSIDGGAPGTDVWNNNFDGGSPDTEDFDNYIDGGSLDG